jgi:hypothetical protein
VIGFLLIANPGKSGQLIAEAVSVQKENTPRTNLSLELEHPAWLDSFRGSIRIWRCDWALNEQSEPLPGAVSIRVSEYHFASDGMEQIALSWQQPFRFDLTPDLSYVRLTDDVTVEVNGNSRGPRAMVFSQNAKARFQTAPYQILSRPVEHFLGRESAIALREMFWIQLEPGDSERIDGSREDRQEAYSGELLVAGSRWRKIRASMLLSGGDAATSEDQSTGASAASLYRGQPSAIDLYADLVEREARQWNGTFAASYRVLEWHTPPKVSTEVIPPWAGFPRLVASDELCSRSSAVGKSYRRMSVALLEFAPNANQTLLPDWEKLLPKMRIADVRSASARLNAVVARDDCGAWEFMKSVSAESSEFVRLITTDLRDQYPDKFRPVTLNLQTTSELGTMGRKTPFCALPNLPVAVDLVKPENSQLIGTASAEDTPKLLALVERVRTLSQLQNPQKEAKPVRRGNQPVTSTEKTAARRTLAEFLVVLSAVSGLIVLARISRFRARTRSLNSLLVMASIVIPTTSSVAGDDLPERIHDGPHVLQARKIVREHCLVLKEVLPDLQDSQIWATILADRKSLVDAWNDQRSTAAPRQKFAFQTWIALLDDQYRDIVADTGHPAPDGTHVPTKSPLLEVRTCATLNTALHDRRTNCYAMALIYHVQCRLAGLDTRVLALPGHVMLCTVKQDDASASHETRLDEVYDAVRHRKLSSDDVAELLRGSWCVLEDEQLPSVLAFNVGTALSRSGGFDQAARCLEIAIERQFPFPDALKNLCLTYWHERRFSEIVERCGEYQCSAHSEIEGSLRSTTSATARKTLREIDGLHARALSALGRTNEALSMLEHRLCDFSDSTDFRLYRLYVEIKRASNSVSSGIDSKIH